MINLPVHMIIVSIKEKQLGDNLIDSIILTPSPRTCKIKKNRIVNWDKKRKLEKIVLHFGTNDFHCRQVYKQTNKQLHCFKN